LGAELGIEFFAFDWYFNALKLDPWDENLNSALEIMRSLPDKHGMKYAMLYVNQDPFIVPDASWSATVAQWVGYMQDADYVRVNGKPLLIVIDAYRMHSDLGSAAAVRAHFDELRASASDAGLGGVYLIAGLYITDGAVEQDGLFPDLSAVAADGYDAVSTYGLAPSVPLNAVGAQPFQVLADTVQWTWTQAALKSPVAVVPLAMTGGDSRALSADHEPGRGVYWFDSRPEDVASSLAATIDLAEANPRVRPEPSPGPPLLLLQGWNELSNGAYLVPTVADGTSYGDAIGRVLASPPARTRTLLHLDTGSLSAQPPSIGGTLTDSSGNPLPGEPVLIEIVPAGGAVRDYQISGWSPPDAGMAMIGFRLNTSDRGVLWPGFWFAGEASADLSLYRVSYIQPSDGIERVPDPDFYGGSALWTLGGTTTFEPSDQWPGPRVRAVAGPQEAAWLSSSSFPVSGETPFDLVFTAAVAPGTEAAGYFFVAFEDRPGNFLGIPSESAGALRSETTPMAPGPASAGELFTDATGSFVTELPFIAGPASRVRVYYPGDAGYWPAEAELRP
jgi:hypothetical protein